MKLVSWNLNGLEDEYIDMRTEAAMFQILLGVPIEDAIAADFEPNTPDIILLQEVVERTYFAHVKPHLQAAGFTLFPKEPTIRSYFEVVAVRQKVLDVSHQPFSYSQQGRELTTLRLDGLTVMTAHLESMKPGKQERIDQAQYVLDKMSALGPCVFAGDTNLRKAEWEGLNNANIVDAWISAGSEKTDRITWQQAQKKSRFDRVWTHQIGVKNFETFGKDKVPTLDVRPSDHYGLRVELDV